MNKKEFRIGNIVKASQYDDTEEAKDELGEDYSIDNEWDIVTIESIEHDLADWAFSFEKISNQAQPDPEIWKRSEPIPITNERLIKLGFRKTFNNLLFLPMPSIKSEIHYETHNYGNVVTIESSTGMLIPNNIEFVHQLQNLYFALTGTELELS